MNQTDRSALTLGRRLGQGGQGTVYAVANRRINQQWDVVYKEYTPAALANVQVSALTAMVDLVPRLPRAGAEWLCEKASWPAEIVESHGQVAGFLMRSVPDRYRFDLRNLNAATGTSKKLATLEFLLNDDAYVAQIGLSVSERDRLLLLADVATTLTRLHSMGIAVGDLSPKNLLFCTTPHPECFIIDCDAMRLNGMDVLPQVETPDWQIPDGEEKGTRHSDAYKFALLAIRIFARNQGSTDPAALAAVDGALGALARAGLAHDPHNRPTPAEWAERLVVAAQSASTAPARGAAGSNGAPRPSAVPAVRAVPAVGAVPGVRAVGAGGGSRGQNLGVAAVAAALVIGLLVLHGITNDHSGNQTPTALNGTGGSSEPVLAASNPVLPAEVPSLDPTSDAPAPDPTTAPNTDPATTQYQPPPPPPPPKHYGAIAVAHDGSYGRAWNYSSSAAAARRALASCPRSDCKILVRFVNACGAIAYNPSTNHYWGGYGATQVQAEENAISHAGGGHWITWVCTTR